MTTHVIRIDGLALKSPNRRRGNTRLAGIIHAREVSAFRSCVQLHVAAKGLRKLGPPASVHFVRVAPRRMDSDNHVSAWKGGRDALCNALGFDDASLVIAEDMDGVACTFEQRTDGRRVGIEIHLRWSA